MKKITLNLAILLANFSLLTAQITEFITGVDNPSDMVKIGNEIYVTEFDGNKVSKFDTTSQNPQKIDVVTNLNKPFGLVSNGNDLYISEFGTGNILKIDITAPTPTTPVTVFNIGGSPTGMLIKNNTLYVTEFNGGEIFKIDLSASTINANSFFKASALNGPVSLALNQNDLFISSQGSSTIYKLDISLPSTQILGIAAQSTLGGPNDIVLNGNDLFIANGGEVLKTDITLSDIQQPIFITTTEVDAPQSLLLDNDTLYISERFGDRILKLSNLSSTLTVNSFAETDKNLSIYPNPVKDFLHIEGPITKSAKILLYNTSGQLINTITYNKTDGTVDFKNLIGGNYFLQIIDSKKTLTKQFLKK